jgi:putative hemolysin
MQSPSPLPVATEPAATAGLRADVYDVLARHGGMAARILGPPRLARIGGLERLLALHARIADLESPAFAEAALSALDIEWRLVSGDPDVIPRQGPLLVVCNHPTGALEALICLGLIDARRGDRRTLGLAAIGRIPELSASQLGVGAPGARGNRTALKTAGRHLADGGCVLVFPAGTVAHARLPSLRVSEAPWHPAIARLAAMCDAPVLPIAVEARASRLWRVASALSRNARTALLARELLAQRGTRPGVRIGCPIDTQTGRRQLFSRGGM